MLLIEHNFAVSTKTRWVPVSVLQSQNKKLEKEEVMNNTVLFLQLVPLEPGERSWKVTCTIPSCVTVSRERKEMTFKLKNYFKFYLGMKTQFPTSLLVLKYSVESRKAKIAMAERKLQISEYIRVGLPPLLSHSHTSLNPEADNSLGRPSKPCVAAAWNNEWTHSQSTANLTCFQSLHDIH